MNGLVIIGIIVCVFIINIGNYLIFRKFKNDINKYFALFDKRFAEFEKRFNEFEKRLEKEKEQKCQKL